MPYKTGPLPSNQRGIHSPVPLAGILAIYVVVVGIIKIVDSCHRGIIIVQFDRQEITDISITSF